MISLIKNELIKIFKKKSLYIILLIVLAFIVFINIMYKVNNNNTYYGIYEGKYIEYLYNDIEMMEKSGKTDTEDFIRMKTDYDLMKLKKQYENNWKMRAIDSFLYMPTYEMNAYKYKLNTNIVSYETAKEMYDEYIGYINSDNWRAFAELEKKNAEADVKGFELALQSTPDNKELKQQLETAKVVLEVANLRLEKGIPYDGEYRDQALSVYHSSKISKIQSTSKEELRDYNEKQNEQSLDEGIAINKYIIDTGEDVLRQDSLKGALEMFYLTFSTFIVIWIVIIGASIVSDEFSKGTIKLLLVRPHSRVKIILSKFITLLIMIVIIMVTLLVAQTIVGGIIYGIDSISLPTVKYNHNTNALETMNIFKYLAIESVALLPYFILIATIAFAVSTVLTNSLIGIVIAILGMISNEIFNMLTISFKLEFMKFFITPNWHMEQYLFGRLPMVEYVSFWFSAIMCIIYLVAMLAFTLIVFKKKDIKNV